MPSSPAFLPSPSPSLFRPRLALRRGPEGRPGRRVPRAHPRAQSATPDSNIDKYNRWIAESQEARNETAATSSSLASAAVTAERRDTSAPPPFPHASLFHASAEEYASDMTFAPSPDFRLIATETERAGLFAPCMVGAVEGQFLKMLARINRAARVLDIGTFTGYSALAFAEGVRQGGEVVTVEADPPTAAVARKVFDAAECGGRIRLMEGDARVIVDKMASDGEKFDIVFLDADKTNYRMYYEAGLKMLNDGGVILADNALCALLYAEDDPVRQSLHEFAQFVRSDDRVEQVMLTVREGILVVQKV